MSGSQQPRRLHPLTILVDLVSKAPGTILPLVFLLILSDEPSTFLLWLFGLAGLMALVAPTLRYLSLRYSFHDDELEIRSGIIFQVVRAIPVGRIQNIDIVRTLAHRLLGVAEIRIETAGGSDTEAPLSVVSVSEAESLRATLLAARADRRNREGRAAPEAATGSTVVRASSLKELLLAGATENRIGVIVAALFGLLEFVDAGPKDIERTIAPWLEGRAEVLTQQRELLVAAFVVMLVLAGWLVSIVMTVAAHHGFSLRRTGEVLRSRQGLLTRLEAVIPQRRIQVLHFEANLIRRLAGWWSVGAETAGSRNEKESGGATTLCPLLPEAELPGFIQSLLTNFDSDARHLTAVHPLSRRRGFLRAMLVGGVPLGISASVIDARLAWILLPWTLIAWLYACARYRALGYALTDEHLVARAGLWTRRTWIVPLEKVQTVAVRASPFQRRLGLATLMVDTAGSQIWSRPRVEDLDEVEALRVFEILAATSHATGSLRGV